MGPDAFGQSRDCSVTFDPILTLSTDSVDANLPQLERGNGTLHVLWFGNGPQTGGGLQYSRSNDAGAGFEPARTLLSYDSCLATRGYIAADENNAYVACIIPTTQTPFYAAAVIRSTDNGVTWLPPRALYGGTIPAFISAGGQDVYMQVIGTGNSRLTLRSGSAGERWDTLKVYQPALTDIAPWGDYLHAVGVAEIGSRSEVVYYISGTRGMYWYGPEPMSREDLTPSTLPSICVNERGNPLVVWNDTGAVKMRRSLNKGFSWPAEIIVSSGKSAVMTDIAASETYIGVVWDNNFADSGAITLRTSNTFGRDLCRTEAPTPALRVGEPSVQMSANTMHIVWAESDSGFSRVHYRTAVLPIDPDLIPPESFSLGQNYPNPFNGSTTFSYEVAAPGTIRIRIFNLLGQVVSTPLDSYLPAGRYSLTFEAGQLPSGVYFYELSGPGYSGARKLVIIR